MAPLILLHVIILDKKVTETMFQEVSSISRALSFGSRTGLWVTIAVFCVGCASVRERDAELTALHDARQESPLRGASSQQTARHDRLQHLASRHRICNVAVAVVRNRELQSVDAAHGCDTESPSTQGSVFEAASLSKPVFAYAVLKLVQQGKMDLDAPVLKYLPHGYAHRHRAYLADSPIDQVSDPKLSAVTVRMVLNHTSGLPNWSDGPLVFDGEPGAKWQYSGEGYVLLQRAVEAVTGEALGEFMKHQIFDPLGMTHSAYTRQAALEKHIAPGSNGHGDLLTPLPFREPVAAFTLYTSASDYGRFLATLLKDEPTLRQIVESPVSVSTQLNLSWGLGWGLERNRAEVFLWHWGNNSGYRAFVMASPRTGDGFVMFTNNDMGLSLAEPLGEEVFAGPHQVYRFHLLRDGLANLLCEMLDICP
jgi:CubicO group peptidase (beta-lactamase class C family)